MKFNEYIRDKKMSEIVAINERIVQNIVNLKSGDLKYQPIKDEIDTRREQESRRRLRVIGKERNKKSRQNFRRPQPAIEQNIKNRGLDKEKKGTQVSYELLRKEKNRVDMLWSPVLSAEIFKSKPGYV